jgi:two-component system CheB/CheR fusion protein
MLQHAQDLMARQLHHLTQMVDDLLDVSRITRGKIELRKVPKELNRLIQHAVDSVRPLLEAQGHELVLALSTEPVRLEVDPTRVEQVLQNLLSNAAKYTERGGRIEVSAGREDSDAVVIVRDNGIGIPQELLPRVFDLFTQADRSLDRSQGGLGIGLTLVRRLIEMHGGSVTARSDGPGKGSEFVVRLPALPQQQTVEIYHTPEHGTPAVPIMPLRILVVDDNVDAARSLAMLLGLWGHEVQVAHDGPAALAAVQQVAPAVVLLDIGLPGMDGYQVARRLRESLGRHGTKLVAVTGYGQDEDRTRALEAGFDLHMVKPVDPAALQRLLAEVQPDLRPGDDTA